MSLSSSSRVNPPSNSHELITEYADSIVKSKMLSLLTMRQNLSITYSTSNHALLSERNALEEKKRVTKEKIITNFPELESILNPFDNNRGVKRKMINDNADNKKIKIMDLDKPQNDLDLSRKLDNLVIHMREQLQRPTVAAACTIHTNIYRIQSLLECLKEILLTSEKVDLTNKKRSDARNFSNVYFIFLAIILNRLLLDKFTHTENLEEKQISSANKISQDTAKVEQEFLKFLPSDLKPFHGNLKVFNDDKFYPFFTRIRSMYFFDLFRFNIALAQQNPSNPNMDVSCVWGIIKMFEDKDKFADSVERKRKFYIIVEHTKILLSRFSNKDADKLMEYLDKAIMSLGARECFIKLKDPVTQILASTMPAKKKYLNEANQLISIAAGNNLNTLFKPMKSPSPSSSILNDDNNNMDLSFTN